MVVLAKPYILFITGRESTSLIALAQDEIIDPQNGRRRENIVLLVT